MVQKDYILAEIEKIGTLMRMLVNRLKGQGDKIGREEYRVIQDTKEKLLNDLGMDVDMFCDFEQSEMVSYLNQKKGFNVYNIEMLANLFYHMAAQSQEAIKTKYLQTALKLYTICNFMDRTFSLEREHQISVVQSQMQE